MAFRQSFDLKTKIGWKNLILRKFDSWALKHILFDTFKNKGIKFQMINIPQSTQYYANRYDTDDEYVITLWNHEKTYDIRIKK